MNLLPNNSASLGADDWTALGPFVPDALMRWTVRPSEESTEGGKTRHQNRCSDYRTVSQWFWDTSGARIDRYHAGFGKSTYRQSARSNSTYITMSGPADG